MSWNDHMAGGLSATVLLTTTLSAAKGLGYTRMDVPYLLGTALTADRDRAKRLGFAFHALNGWIFTFLYFSLFPLFPPPPPLTGAILGLFHALFVLAVGMPLLPSFHPRMADVRHGPDAARMLEPPGFLARNYGRGTPLTTIAGHVLFGFVLGLAFRH